MSALPPPNPLTLWADGDWLRVQLTSANGLTHQLALPNTIDGAAQLLEIVNQRRDSSRLGTLGDPTTWQLEHKRPGPAVYDLAKVRRVDAAIASDPASRSKVRDVLRKVGLL